MVIIVLSLSLVIFTNLSQIKLCHTNVRRGGKKGTEKVCNYLRVSCIQGVLPGKSPQNKGQLL